MEFANSSNTEPDDQDNSAFRGGLGIQQNSVLRSKSSKYRGVQKIKGKETYVAHVYDNGHTPNESRTIYLGRFDKEENAARAHDLVSLKFWGPTAMTNFPVEEYEKELEAMANMSDQDVMVAVRRSSNSFSRGKSKYRGVVGHTNSGKWQARKGPGKDSFLGTYDTEEEAAIAFDIASIKQKGFKAITNFDIKSYNIVAILEDDGAEDHHDDDNVARNRKKKGHSNLNHFLRKNNKGQTSSSNSNNNNNNSLGSDHHENPIVASVAYSGLQDDAAVGLAQFFSGALSIGPPSSSGGPDTSLMLGFNHSDSSAFQSYNPDEQQQQQGYDHQSYSMSQEGNNFLAPGFEFWSPNLHPSYETSLFQGQEFKDLGGVGFQHAGSSCFQPFTKP